jgi:hypothetical protein
MQALHTGQQERQATKDLLFNLERFFPSKSSHLFVAWLADQHLPAAYALHVSEHLAVVWVRENAASISRKWLSSVIQGIQLLQEDSARPQACRHAWVVVPRGAWH